MASASAPNRLREFLSSRRYGPTRAMIGASSGSAAIRCRTALRALNPGPAIGLLQAGEERPGAHRRRALDLEDAPLGVDAAGGREAAHLAVGRQHAMARHDDGDRIFAEGRADLACLLGLGADALGDLAVGQGLAR